MMTYTGPSDCLKTSRVLDNFVDYPFWLSAGEPIFSVTSGYEIYNRKRPKAIPTLPDFPGGCHRKGQYRKGHRYVRERP